MQKLMQKLMQKHRKFLKGDAGFSLVELIIVIAIMAALIAILAPQYLKYVERSRIQADVTTGSELLQAVKVLASDPAIAGTAFSVAWDEAAGGLTVTGITPTTLVTDMTGTNVGAAKATNTADLTISVSTTGVVTVSNTVVSNTSGVASTWPTVLNTPAT
ncbi:MAG: prepilin-type N-terminal cleavage/methylation domain-containing protein [Clostridiales bacterium]|nr:prepilin-type N-terminal cleavage/methylation domain-containing protein [Clostridiales bacterium]